MRRVFSLGLFLCALCVLCGFAEAATLTATTLSRNGVDLTATVVAQDGTKADKFLNDGVSYLCVSNASGGSLTVTIAWGSGGVVDGSTPTARTVTVTNGDMAMIGPFPANFYNDANGYVNFTYSTATSVKVAIIKPGS